MRVIAHATEDVSRVREALDFFLSGAGVKEAGKLVEELQAEGHHGNPITILSVQLKKKAECLNFAVITSYSIHYTKLYDFVGRSYTEGTGFVRTIPLDVLDGLS